MPPNPFDLGRVSIPVSVSDYEHYNPARMYRGWHTDFINGARHSTHPRLHGDNWDEDR